MPYDRWWQALTGSTFNELVGWQRNNYDRVVHFSLIIVAIVRSRKRPACNAQPRP